MLFLLVSFLSFLVLSKSVSLDPLPSWVNEMRLLSLLFGQELLYFLVHWLKQTRRITSAVLRIPPAMSSAKKKVSPLLVEIEAAAEEEEMSVLDLPELTLECILGHLSPAGLCNMAAVCASLRERCRSDHLWEKHMKEKWGRLIGPAARREWEAYVSSGKNYLASPSGGSKERKWLESLSCMWPLSWFRSTADDGGSPKSSVPVGSTMSWYMALESGRFWFPAQVFNRENGHVGFMLSCYDAELSYDCHTDTFHARYPPHGRRIMVAEEGVQWDRLRAPPIDAPAHDLHASDCLHDLHPGDHIEIQWRRSKEFPYGWWYGIVGHLESCDGHEHHCCCRTSDTVVLEFKQYAVGSRWRQAIINRKDHREEGNETDGFYGGIRKLQREEEIAMWRRLWPNEVLD